MSYLLKKYKILLIITLLINVPLLCLAAIRTNKQILLKGDTTIVSSLMSVSSSNEEAGSFSTIYVVSVSHSTILHNFLASFINSADISDMSSSSSHFSDLETYRAGKIMYESAKQTSLIAAYNKALEYSPDLTLSYSYNGVEVTSYPLGSNYKIGDLITKFYDNETNTYYDLNDYASFIDALNNKQSISDIIYYTRDDINYELVLNEAEVKSFRGYSTFNIDFEASSFNVSYKSTNVGGPSGGLLQALEIFNRLTPKDYSFGLNISGTGTMSSSGNVGVIGGIKQKIYTAFDDNKDVFFCPEGNYEEALAAYNTLKNKERMALVMVRTLDEAISYLVGTYDA